MTHLISDIFMFGVNKIKTDGFETNMILRHISCIYESMENMMLAIKAMQPLQRITTFKKIQAFVEDIERDIPAVIALYSKCLHTKNKRIASAIIGSLMYGMFEQLRNTKQSLNK